jgi:hypothetical protein
MTTAFMRDAKYGTDVNSRTTPRTIDGLRVAVAGLPNAMPVRLGDGLDFKADNVGDLRALKTLPCQLEVLIPYRLMPDSFVAVNLFIPEWKHESER